MMDLQLHVLIIANGTIPHPDFVRALVKFSKKVICADGGANYARELEIKPDLIIGDFDSITPVTLTFFRDVAQLHVEDQNSPDLEKAIKHCIDLKFTSVDIVGASGDRIDHTMASLGCFKKFGEKIHIRMIDSMGELTLIRKEIHLELREGERISLIPLDHCSGITTKNLKYSLKNETLEIGVREGISNEALAKQVTISIASGTLLLYRFHGSTWKIPHH